MTTTIDHTEIAYKLSDAVFNSRWPQMLAVPVDKNMMRLARFMGINWNTFVEKDGGFICQGSYSYTCPITTLSLSEYQSAALLVWPPKETHRDHLIPVNRNIDSRCDCGAAYDSMGSHSHWCSSNEEIGTIFGTDFKLF